MGPSLPKTSEAAGLLPRDKQLSPIRRVRHIEISGSLKLKKLEGPQQSVKNEKNEKNEKAHS